MGFLLYEKTFPFIEGKVSFYMRKGFLLSQKKFPLIRGKVSSYVCEKICDSLVFHAKEVHHIWVCTQFNSYITVVSFTRYSVFRMIRKNSGLRHSVGYIDLHKTIHK